MIDLILNNEDISTDLSSGVTVLDFVRYYKNLKGTKIGCREGDCGACTIMVGELRYDRVRYRTMTSCLMPLANASGKHIVTIEGINPPDGSLTPVQQAMVDENGTQCGFCTVGFVMSLTGFCLERADQAAGDSHQNNSGSTLAAAISSIDGNICRCTGYKSIERAAGRVCSEIENGEAAFVPAYFGRIRDRLAELQSRARDAGKAAPANPLPFIAGGTDVYVQRPEQAVDSAAAYVLYDDALRGIRDLGDSIEIRASATVTDLLESPGMQATFPNLYDHMKLVSSTPIRNMATIAGNFANASPIGDMTIWFLALNAEIELRSPPVLGGVVNSRTIPLRRLYLGYKQLEKSPEEIITAIRFKKPTADHYFNFEKVSKRTYLDIATVNSAILLKCEPVPGQAWTPPALRYVGVDGKPGETQEADATGSPRLEHVVLDAHVSAGGVAPIPLYLKETSSFLVGRTINEETIEKANEIMQLEISPISDVRGTDNYKRILLRQLFRAHFVELRVKKAS